MSGSLYEGYKEALRRGHVAALRGRHRPRACRPIREAARIAPDRPCPTSGWPAALARLGRVDEALRPTGRRLAARPTTRARSAGRADLLEAEGRPAEAAGSLDRLAGVLERADRTADACDVARRALELAESRGRRRLVQTLVARLRESAADPAVAEALDRAMSVLEVDAIGSRAEPSATTEPRPDATAAAEPPPPRRSRRVPPPDADRPEPRLRGRDRCRAISTRPASRPSRRPRPTARRASSTPRSMRATRPSPSPQPTRASTSPWRSLYLDRGWRTLAADKLVLIGRLAAADRRHGVAGPAVRSRRSPVPGRSEARRPLRVSR